MPKGKDRSIPEIQASSMADIAFLLLIFFLVVTTIQSEEGIKFPLPPKVEEPIDVKKHDRNILKVVLYSNNKLVVEDEPFDVANLKSFAKEFLSNNGVNPSLSDNPNEAIVSYRADRGATYERFLAVLHELKAAYQELRAESVNLTIEEFMTLDKKEKSDAKLILKAKEAYPFQLSKAESKQ